MKLNSIMFMLVTCAIAAAGMLLGSSSAFGIASTKGTGPHHYVSKILHSAYTVTLKQIEPAESKGLYRFHYELVGPVDAQVRGVESYQILLRFEGNDRYGSITKSWPMSEYRGCHFDIESGEQADAPSFRVIVCDFVLYNNTSAAKALIAKIEGVYGSPPEYYWESPELRLASCVLGEDAECAQGSQVCINSDRVIGSEQCAAFPIVTGLRPLGTRPLEIPSETEEPPEEEEPAIVDQDADGIADADDNCQLMPNPVQENMDNDAFGDACDDDIDGDGVLNVSDNCIVVANADQADVDGDLIGDSCDSIDNVALAEGALVEEDVKPAVEIPELAEEGETELGDVTETESEFDIRGWGAEGGGKFCSLNPGASMDLTFLALFALTSATLLVSRRRKK